MFWNKQESSSSSEEVVVCSWPCTVSCFFHGWELLFLFLFCPGICCFCKHLFLQTSDIHRPAFIIQQNSILNIPSDPVFKDTENGNLWQDRGRDRYWKWLYPFLYFYILFFILDMLYPFLYFFIFTSLCFSFHFGSDISLS